MRARDVFVLASLAGAASCAAAAMSASSVVPLEAVRAAGACGSVPVAADHVGEKLGALTYRGGVALGRGWPGAHGVSGVEAKGDSLVLVTDVGALLEMRAVVEDGVLTGVADCREIDPITDGQHGLATLTGRRGKRQLDAEDITSTDDRTLFVVSFEREHAVIPFSWDGGLSPKPLEGPGLGDTKRLSANQGLEALALLSDGSLLAGAESPGLFGAPHPVWRFNPTGDLDKPFADAEGPAFEIVTEPGYGLTGFDRTPDGDVLVLERFWTPDLGARAKLGRIAEKLAAGAGGRVTPDEIARLTPGQWPPVDNFEAVASDRGPEGEIRVWLMSDDNFSDSQRTLLYLFTLGD